MCYYSRPLIRVPGRRTSMHKGPEVEESKEGSWYQFCVAREENVGCREYAVRDSIG